MRKEKEVKTNAMRILDREKVSYRTISYEADEFTDGITLADKLGIPHEKIYKTLVTVGKSGGYYVFVVPVEAEIDFRKAAKAAGEKSLELLPLKNLTAVTGYVRGGCTSVGMKKNYPTFIQQEVLTLPLVTVSGGRIGTQLELVPADLIRVTGARTADVTAD